MQSIRLLRELVGINQLTLAEASGISRKSISHYETGRAFPTRAMCKRLDDAIVGLMDKRALEAVQRLRYDRVPEELVPRPGAGEPPPDEPGDDKLPEDTTGGTEPAGLTAANGEG